MIVHALDHLSLAKFDIGCFNLILFLCVDSLMGKPN